MTTDDGRPRVLVIDDEAAIGMILKHVLRSYQVVAVQDGDVALAELDARPYDAILCDLSMPGKSGIDIFNAANSRQRARFLFMTGGAFTEASQAFLDEVSQPVVAKPFNSAQLRDKVADIIAGAGAAAGANGQ